MGCPVCSGELSVLGTCDRKVIMADGDEKILILRRLRCSQCRKIHHELPDILIPYKRHCAETIDTIIDGKLESVYVDESALRRIKLWWDRLLLCFQSIPASLETKYGIRYSGEIKPAKVARTLANAHLWIHTRSACAP
jgi:hypothetical protein